MTEMPREWVRGTLNFAADRNNGGRIATLTGEKDQSLISGDVDIRNIRCMQRPPRLDDEGFVIAAHPAGEARWDDKAWIDTVYVPSCLELVRQLSGARHAINMYDPIKRTRVPDGKLSQAADFIHFDQTRDQYLASARSKAAEHGQEFKRAAILNVWKSLTPPPQDLPLTFATRCSVPESDHVPGISFGAGYEAWHIKLAQSDARPEWYYVPDLGLDESLVFVAADFDPAAPLGCAHSAFEPHGASNLVPRTSIEVRVLAIYE